MAQSIDGDSQLRSEDAIWRYMDVARFLALIYQRKLYFARLHELDDPREGIWTAPASDQNRHAATAVQAFNRLALISCWHQNEWESVAMWKLYVSGREGVALKTTVGRLYRVLTLNSDRKPTIRGVQYEDAAYDPEPSDHGSMPYAEWFLFRKSKGYEHEQEVRAVVYDPLQSAHDAASEASDVASGRATPTQLDKGGAVAVDLSILIERIVVSPDFPLWAVGALQTAVTASGINVKAELSSLLDRPDNALLGAQR